MFREGRSPLEMLPEMFIYWSCILGMTVMESGKLPRFSNSIWAVFPTGKLPIAYDSDGMQKRCLPAFQHRGEETHPAFPLDDQVEPQSLLGLRIWKTKTCDGVESSYQWLSGQSLHKGASFQPPGAPRLQIFPTPGSLASSPLWEPQ